MNKRLSLALASTLLSTLAQAQTPANNPMPDGSRDMYAGLGLQSAPRYEGTDRRRVSVLPVLQVEWSNGVFISGMSAGMHLSTSPTVEFGPLLSVLPGRDKSGAGTAVVGDIGHNGLVGAPAPGQRKVAAPEPLAGMDEIGVRLQVGGFYNLYLNPRWRLTSSLLTGSGRHHDGLRLAFGVQRLAAVPGERHRVSLAAGVGFVNARYNETYFGVTEEEAARGGLPVYQPGGGLQDVHAGVRWNWVLDPAWMLSSDLQAKRLLGDARQSPLTERSTNLTVSTALAYRF